MLNDEYLQRKIYEKGEKEFAEFKSNLFRASLEDIFTNYLERLIALELKIENLEDQIGYLKEEIRDE